MTKIPLILASSSPRRLELLSRIGIVPDQIISPDIDETEHKGELPRQVAIRLAQEKACKVADAIESGYIISGDSVAAVGRRILPKAMTDDEVRSCLSLLSGKKHRLYTGVTIIKKQDGQIIAQRNRLVQTALKFKRLTDEEITSYIESGEGIGKAGGYSIEGFAQCFVQNISGSFSNIVGLPLFETRNMLVSLGFFNSQVILGSSL